MRKKLTAAAVLLLLIVGGAWWWLSSISSGLYSDPTQRRQETGYEDINKEFLEFAVLPSHPLENATFSTNGNTITVSIKEFKTEGERIRIPITIHRPKNTNRVSIGDGAIEFLMLQTGWEVPTTNFGYSIPISGNFYRPGSLEKLDPSKLPIQTDNKLQFSGDFPAAQFYFSKTNLPDFRLVDTKAFDGRTKASLTRGYSSSLSYNTWSFRGTIPIWHQTPLEFATTIAVGPSQTYEAPATNGVEIRYPSGLIKLLGGVEGKITEWSSGSGSGTETTRFTLAEDDSPDSKAQCVLVFSILPEANYLSLDVEALDLNGNVIRNSGNSFGGRMLSSSFPCHLSEIRTLRVKVYPNLHRIIWTLPELPGLPEENRGVRNLFDVKVPYMRFHFEAMYQGNFHTLVQMKMPYLPLLYPSGYFPTVRTNFTPKDLFHELQTSIPPTPSFANRRLIIDSKHNTITLERPLWELLLEKTKKLFGIK